MTMMTLAPDAVALIDAAKPILTRGDWGDGVSAVCFMSALVPRAREESDCVTAGWPEWLVNLCVDLFDVDTLEYGGEEANDQAAIEWAESMAWALSREADYDAVRRTFIDELLEECIAHDQGGIIARVRRGLERQRLDPGAPALPAGDDRIGPDVPMEMAEIATYVLVGALAPAAECVANLFTGDDYDDLTDHLGERARQRQSLVDAIATSRDDGAAI